MSAREQDLPRPEGAAAKPGGASGAARGAVSGAGWRPATRLVRGGLRRSEFGETAEALFLTSGFRYDSAEAAEARFKGEAEGFVYSRFGSSPS